MIFCENCFSNNSYSGFRKVENNAKQYYVCRNCSRKSPHKIKKYTLKEIEEQLKWTLIELQ
jgi:protein-arginine kinase activator protein McsA